MSKTFGDIKKFVIINDGEPKQEFGINSYILGVASMRYIMKMVPVYVKNSIYCPDQEVRDYPSHAILILDINGKEVELSIEIDIMFIIPDPELDISNMAELMKFIEQTPIQVKSARKNI